MIIQQDSNSADFQIQSYEAGQICVNKVIYKTSLIIRPKELLTWEPSHFAQLKADHFKPILDNPPNIVLLGTGAKLIIPDMSLFAELWEKGIGVEWMDSRAACLTYAALSAEGRSIAACILID